MAQSDVEAVRWSPKPADQRHAGAQYNLGMHLYFGQGVPRDLAASDKYLALAAAQGEDNAKGALNAYFPNGAPKTEPQPSVSVSCAFCGVAARNLKAYARCKTVYYCKRECQTAHWKAGHKKECASAETR